MKTTLVSDKELLALIAQNRSDAFEILFNQYNATLIRVLKRYSSDPEEVKDWIQEIYVKLWKKRAAIRIENIENVKGYIIVIAKNHVLKHLGKKKQVKLVFGDQAAEREIPDNCLQEDFDHNELWNAYINATTKLPPRTREVFRLSREKGLSYSKVAESLGISVKTVEVQMSRALFILRRELIGFSLHA